MKSFLGKILIVSFGLFLYNIAFSKQEIRFGTDATQAPLVYLNQEGKVNGFEAELVEAMCAKMPDTTCTMKHQAFDSLIPALNLRKIDAIFGVITVTEKRMKQVDFTETLYKNAIGLISRDNIKLDFDIKTLKNKTIGVQLGSSMEQFLKHKYSNNIKIKTYVSLQDALLDLNNDRLDGVIGDTPVLKKWQENHNGYQLTNLTDNEDLAFFGPGNAIAVRKGNTALRDQLNKAFEAVKADGTYDALYKKYFG